MPNATSAQYSTLSYSCLEPLSYSPLSHGVDFLIHNVREHFEQIAEPHYNPAKSAPIARREYRHGITINANPEFPDAQGKIFQRGVRNVILSYGAIGRWVLLGQPH